MSPSRTKWLAICVLSLLQLFATPPIWAGDPEGTKSDRNRLIQKRMDLLDKALKPLDAEWGGVVLGYPSATKVAGKNEDLLLNPASNQKLFTSYAALSHWGPQRVFATRMQGVVTDGRIEQLSLFGDGDPSLKSGDLLEMTLRLKGKGVRRVERIVVDQSAFGEGVEPPGYEDQELVWDPFRANIAAVSVDGNVVSITVVPGVQGAAAGVKVFPPHAASLDVRVQTGKKGSKEAVEVKVDQKDGKLTLRVSGSIPAEHAPIVRYRRVNDPRLLAGQTVASFLREMGVEVGVEPTLGSAVGPVLIEHTSMPLAVLVQTLGKQSDNFAAEMLFRGLSWEAKRPASEERSKEMIMELIRGKQLWSEGAVLQNGSGLSRQGRTSPMVLARVLLSGCMDPRFGPEFESHLAVGGKDGTLRHRFGNNNSAHTIRAKTGTLRDVVALTGRTSGSDPVVFSIVINHIEGHTQDARKHMDAFVASLP